MAQPQVASASISSLLAISNEALQAKCRKKINETVKKTHKKEMVERQRIQIQHVAPSILKKKPETPDLQTTIPASNAEESREAHAAPTCSQSSSGIWSWE